MKKVHTSREILINLIKQSAEVCLHHLGIAEQELLCGWQKKKKRSHTSLYFTTFTVFGMHVWWGGRFLAEAESFLSMCGCGARVCVLIFCVFYLWLLIQRLIHLENWLIGLWYILLPEERQQAERPQPATQCVLHKTPTLSASVSAS